MLRYARLPCETLYPCGYCLVSLFLVWRCVNVPIIGHPQGGAIFDRAESTDTISVCYAVQRFCEYVCVVYLRVRTMYEFFVFV